jgi:predicted nucleic acid-binding Zn ribbon protein
MKDCKWVPEEGGDDECGAPGFFEFLPSDLVLCEEHCRYTYERFEQHNIQLIWYLALRDKLS